VPYVLKIKNVNKNSSRLIFNLQYFFKKTVINETQISGIALGIRFTFMVD